MRLQSPKGNPQSTCGIQEQAFNQKSYRDTLHPLMQESLVSLYDSHASDSSKSK